MEKFWSEVLAGLLVGTATGASVFAIVTIWKHNFELGLAVGIAMAMAIMVANLAGYLVPVLIDKLDLIRRLRVVHLLQHCQI